MLRLSGQSQTKRCKHRSTLHRAASPSNTYDCVRTECRDIHGRFRPDISRHGPLHGVANIVHVEWIAIAPAMEISHRVQVATEKRIGESVVGSFSSSTTKRILKAREKERLSNEMAPINALLLFCNDSDWLDHGLQLSRRRPRIRGRRAGGWKKANGLRLSSQR